ncbi:hypothetical protein [Lignipirellula cremea]|uniref:Tetratricopeptide repeat protein n=1 Tax=Lignipirellula cremea TaxID=2528010 RepID=A0A518DWX5_9BACT|nr:hypothetical protein [Lignipirellula cremea]QDU96324.1 hypothetical protein Pla8534_41440 [Lignipirellula cremea]
MTHSRNLLLLILGLCLGCSGPAAAPPTAEEPATETSPSRSTPAKGTLTDAIGSTVSPGTGPTDDAKVLAPLKLDATLREPWEEFLASPSEERFLLLRQLLLNHKEYNPQSTQLEQADRLILRERYQEAADLCLAAMPNLLLSPRAHLHLALAAERLGDQERAHQEGLAAATLLSGIEWTGEGTQTLPYLICRSDDALDLMRFYGEGLSGANQLQKGGRYFEVLQTEDGEKVWFDITDMLVALDRAARS